MRESTDLSLLSGRGPGKRARVSLSRLFLLLLLVFALIGFPLLSPLLGTLSVYTPQIVVFLVVQRNQASKTMPMCAPATLLQIEDGHQITGRRFCLVLFRPSC